MVKMILHAFGALDLAPWYALLVKAYSMYTFSIGDEIPTSAKFRVSTIVERKNKGDSKSKSGGVGTSKSRVPTFSADLILEHLKVLTKRKTSRKRKVREEEKKDIHLVLTKHLLVEEKSITSTLYAGLCWSVARLMIVSFARLSNDEVIATVIHHEIGHMLGLPHCEDDKCIMRAGQHGVDVVASTFWCQQCLRGL